MTDRINALTVVLEHDIREDDAAALLSAICQLRGVLSVHTHVAKLEDRIAEDRVRTQMMGQLADVIFGKKPKQD